MARRVAALAIVAAPLSPELADALSSSGSLPLPLLLVYRKGELVRVLPGPRALESVLTN